MDIVFLISSHQLLPTMLQFWRHMNYDQTLIDRTGVPARQHFAEEIIIEI